MPAVAKKDNTNSWLIGILLFALFLQYGGGNPLSPKGPPPIEAMGLHVLIVEETDDRQKLPAGQLVQLRDTAAGTVQSFCMEHCATGGFKKLDKDDDPKLLGEPWVSAWKSYQERSKGATPWLVVSDGKSGKSDPLPGTAAETLKLIEEYAK